MPTNEVGLSVQPRQGGVGSLAWADVNTNLIVDDIDVALKDANDAFRSHYISVHFRSWQQRVKRI